MKNKKLLLAALALAFSLLASPAAGAAEELSTTDVDTYSIQSDPGGGVGH